MRKSISERGHCLYPEKRSNFSESHKNTDFEVFSIIVFLTATSSRVQSYIIPSGERPCAEKKRKPEESKNVFKYQWADIMTEVWQWTDLGFENQKLLAALHEQAQCYIKLTQDGDNEYYELFMRQQGKNMASKVESEKANQQEAKDIISEALQRFRYNKKEKKQ